MINCIQMCHLLSSVDLFAHFIDNLKFIYEMQSFLFTFENVFISNREINNNIAITDWSEWFLLWDKNHSSISFSHRNLCWILQQMATQAVRQTDYIIYFDNWSFTRSQESWLSFILHCFTLHFIQYCFDFGILLIGKWINW